ncbi:hypothetical protein D3C76_1762510 [compost metagenome]
MRRGLLANWAKSAMPFRKVWLVTFWLNDDNPSTTKSPASLLPSPHDSARSALSERMIPSGENRP